MVSVIQQLQELQRRVNERNGEDWPIENCDRLFFAESRGLFDIEFYGDNWEESFDEFLRLLGKQEIAATVRSLSVRGPDRGANGTKNWDFTTLLKSDAVFTKLLSFYVEPTQTDHHNQSIIATNETSYEEDGMIAQLLTKMPAVESLTLPSAPDETFFAVGSKTLARLRVESGYDHKNFILNLSKSTTFPELKFLDFGDYSQTYLENYQEACTPFEHYVALFESEAFARVSYFRLRNPSLSQAKLLELKSLRKDLQFHLVRETGDYVR